MTCANISPNVTAMVEQLIRASIDQPKPTKRLRKAVNAILDAMQHELSTKDRNDRTYTKRAPLQREIL